MKKKVLFLTIAFLGIILLGFSFNATNVVRATIIFSDNFQNGNLNNWTEYRGTLAINSQITNNGEPYSVQSIISDGLSDNLYYHSLASVTNPIDLREYVYVNSTTTPSNNGDYYEVGGFSTSGAPNLGDGELIVTNVGGTLYWGVFYREATGASNPSGFARQISTSNSTSTAVRVTVGWTCLELKHLTASSPGVFNGEEQLFVNGILVVDATNVANGDRTPANVIIGGSQTSTNPSEIWNYYIADVIVSDSYIGPNQNQLTTSTNFGTVSPSNTTYAEGQPVTITATPPTTVTGERYVWQGWTGTGPGNYTGTGTLSGDGVSYTAQVTMNGNITETATWEHQYQLTILSPYGSAIGNQTWFDAGNSAYAAITPTTVAGTNGIQYVFTNWSGDASGSSSPSNAIVMNSTKTAVASWKVQYYLNVTTAHGTAGGTGWYDSGNLARATLNAQIVTGTSGTQYLFTGWAGDATGTNYTQSSPITMNAPKNATTNWQTQYNLTITQSGVSSDFSNTVLAVNGTNYSGTGYNTWANASDVYTFSYAPQLVVSPNSKQYILTGISGNSTASPINITQPTTVTGAYKTQYYFTQTSTYGTPSPSNAWYDNGTSIPAYVGSPVSGDTGVQYVCTGWNGTGSVAASGSSSATTFNITAPSSIAWNWQTQFSVSFATSPSSTGSTSPSGTNVWENQGTISISATPGYGYSFSSWSASTGNIQLNYAGSATTLATINGPGTITASFNANPSPTPTAVPTHAPTPTPTPTPSPTPTKSASPTPTATPTSTPHQISNNYNTLVLYGAIIAVIIVIVVVAAVLVLRKRKKP